MVQAEYLLLRCRYLDLREIDGCNMCFTPLAKLFMSFFDGIGMFSIESIVVHSLRESGSQVGSSGVVHKKSWQVSIEHHELSKR